MMKITRVDATFCTDKLQESKEFYMNYFDFELVYESDWYLEMMVPGMPTSGLSFTLPRRDEGDFFCGTGTILSFEVPDVQGEYQRLKEAGLSLVQSLQDKPWGERSFVVDDPNGIHLYIYETIPATPEYQKIYDSFRQAR